MKRTILESFSSDISDKRKFGLFGVILVSGDGVVKGTVVIINY